MAAADLLGDPGFLDDPYPVYARLREDHPLARIDFGASVLWLVTRYADVEAILKDSRVWKDVTRHPQWGAESQADGFERSMLFRDPPDHTRLRALVSRAFVPAVVRTLEPRIAAIVADLLDDLARRGEGDFMADVARPLPVIVIAELLGVPPADRDGFRRLSELVIRGSDFVTSSAQDMEASQAASHDLSAYFAGLVAQRRAAPGDDLLTRLIAAQAEEGRLAEDELLATCNLLLIAGHETTMNLLGNGLVALLARPDEVDRLRRDRSLVPSAVEEMLRYDAPVQRATFRFAGEAFDLHGQTLHAGDQVGCVLGSANRDPAAFPDPDRFDVGREPNRHLAFGRGIHFCLGAPLARLEATLAVDALIGRFDVDLGTPMRRPGTMFRGYERLPVRLRRLPLPARP